MRVTGLSARRGRASDGESGKGRVPDAGLLHHDQKRLYYGWVVVAVAALGLLLGVFPIAVFSFGVFFRSYVREFHAGRAAISLAFTIQNCVTGLLAVFIGNLADRFGSRKLIVFGLALVGLILISALGIGGNLWQLYLFYAALAAVGGATTSVPYSLVVSRWFNRRRGLALGLMMSGLGLGAVLMPVIAEYLIAHVGWRAAFAIVGGTILLIPMPVVGALLKDSPQQIRLVSAGASIPYVAGRVVDPTEGVPWAEIRQSRTFWFMIVAFILVAASVHACIIHLPNLFTDRGASGREAALASSIAGIAVLVGRIATGYFLDRFFGPYVALVMFAGSACGIALLSLDNRTLTIAGAFLVGLAFGGEVDVIAYLVSRYFGLRCLGTAFGFAFGALVLAGGLGPLLMGIGFDHTGSYRLPLATFFVVTLGAAMLITQLGPYRYDTVRRP